MTTNWTVGPWTCAHCGARGAGSAPHGCDPDGPVREVWSATERPTDDGPVGEVPPEASDIQRMGIRYLRGLIANGERRINADHVTGLLDLLDAAEADRQQTAVENRDLLADNLRLTARLRAMEALVDQVDSAEAYMVLPQRIRAALASDAAPQDVRPDPSGEGNAPIDPNGVYGLARPAPQDEAEHGPWDKSQQRYEDGCKSGTTRGAVPQSMRGPIEIVDDTDSAQRVPMRPIADGEDEGDAAPQDEVEHDRVFMDLSRPAWDAARHRYPDTHPSPSFTAVSRTAFTEGWAARDAAPQVAGDEPGWLTEEARRDLTLLSSLAPSAQPSWFRWIRPVADAPAVPRVPDDDGPNRLDGEPMPDMPPAPPTAPDAPEGER